MNRAMQGALILTIGLICTTGLALAAGPPTADVNVVNTPSVNVGNTVATKNVDEPGRTPWATRSQVLPGSGCYMVSDCANFEENAGYSLVFDLPTVPAGKRLIVMTASGGLTEGNGKLLQIQLGARALMGIVFDGMKWAYAGPFFQGTNFSSAIFNANLFVTFGPGETPSVRMSYGGSYLGYSVLTFSGYLIDATN